MGMQMFNGLPYGGIDPDGIHWSDAKTSVKKNYLSEYYKSGISSNGVTLSTDSNGVTTVTGTATANGGRLNLTSKYFVLPAGTYLLSAYIDGTSDKLTSNLQKKSDSSVISSSANPNTPFTLNEDTEVYLGLNVVKDEIYNTTIKTMIRFASIGDDTYVPYVFDNVELKEEIDNSNKSTTLAVDLTNWTQDTTSQSGSTLYKKQISLNHIYAERPSVDIGAASGSVLPTTAEQTAYDLIQYVTVDDTVPCLYLYAKSIPVTAFYINVIGVD